MDPLFAFAASWFSNIEVKMVGAEIRVTALLMELMQSQQMVPLAASSLQISLKLLVLGSSRSPLSASGQLIWNLASLPPFINTLLWHQVYSANHESVQCVVQSCAAGALGR